MEDPKKTEGITPTTDPAQAMKEKYGKVYKVGITVPVDDDESKEFSYYFKRPSVPSYDRYIKTASTKTATASPPIWRNTPASRSPSGTSSPSSWASLTG